MKKSINAKQLPRKGAITIAFLFCLAAPLRATEIISVGDHDLLPNTPNQEIDIFVTNDRATQVNLQGMDFFAQVADGGPGAGGNIIGPSITGTIDKPPEVFSANNTGATDVNPGQEFGDQLVGLFITTNPGTGNGYIAQAGLATVLLGTVTVDTTGFFSGFWPLIMSFTQGGPSTIIAWGDVSDPIHPSDPAGSLFIDGTISVPEPTSVVLGLLAAAALGVVAIRKRRARRSA